MPLPKQKVDLRLCLRFTSWSSHISFLVDKPNRINPITSQNFAKHGPAIVGPLLKTRNPSLCMNCPKTCLWIFDLTKTQPSYGQYQGETGGGGEGILHKILVFFNKLNTGIGVRFVSVYQHNTSHQ